MSKFEERIADDVRRAVHDDILRSNITAGGEVFFVVEDSDINYQSLVTRYGNKRVFTTLNGAYDAAVTNRDDIILVSAKSSHTLSAAIAWTKSRIHVIGLDGGNRLVQQGTKIQTLATDTAAYVIKNTGTRNTFKNVKFIQASTESTALTVFQFGGEGNVYENCSFVFGVDTNLDGSETTTYEVLMGEDSGTFIRCMFGSDTLVTTGARAVMAIDQVKVDQEMKSCIFVDCIWMISSTNASADFIRVLATTDCKFTQIFKNPIMISAIVTSLSAVALDDAIRSVSGLVEGNLLFINPVTNATELCSDVTDQVKVIGPGLDGTTPAQKIGIALTPS